MKTLSTPLIVTDRPVGLTARDAPHYFLERGIGVGPHFVVGPVLNRVRDEHSCRRESERLCLRFGGLDEHCRGDEDSDDAAGLEITDVVHTARRATASIRKGLDDHLALGGDLVA